MSSLDPRSVPPTDERPVDTPTWPRGDGQMAARIRAFDWSATPLGPIDRWPAHLRTAVEIMLGAGVPMNLKWGEAFTLLYNDAYAPLLGHRHPTALGRPLREVWTEAWTEVVPMLARVMEQGESVRLSSLPFQLRDPSGGSVTRWFDGGFSPLRDETERPAGVLEVVVETTTPMLAERESRRRLDAVLDNASVSIFLMDEHQHCVYMNAAAEKLTGYTLAETTGRPLHDVVHHTRPDGSHYPLEECPIDRAFPENNQEQGEETFVHKDGSFYPVAFTASPIRDDTARVVGTIIEVRDIRVEKQALQALREADRRKDEFLAMLSHELRNPLSPIVNAHALLARTEPLSERGRRALDMAQRQAHQLRRLVDDLLEVSRVSRGKIELRPEAMRLDDAIRQAIDSVLAASHARGQELRATLPGEPVPIQGDPVRVAQILENLLTNAIKYTPEGGHIHVELTRDGDWADIRVTDDGVGIAPDKIPHLFELFSQIEATLDRAQGGLGIGLALVRRLVEMHGGSVAACSDGPGRGSVFQVRLPCPGSADPR